MCLKGALTSTVEDDTRRHRLSTEPVLGCSCLSRGPVQDGLHASTQQGLVTPLVHRTITFDCARTLIMKVSRREQHCDNMNCIDRPRKSETLAHDSNNNTSAKNKAQPTNGRIRIPDDHHGAQPALKSAQPFILPRLFEPIIQALRQLLQPQKQQVALSAHRPRRRRTWHRMQFIYHVWSSAARARTTKKCEQVRR